MIKTIHNRPRCRKPHKPPERSPRPKLRAAAPPELRRAGGSFQSALNSHAKNPPHPAGSHSCRTGRALVSVHSGGSATPRRTPPPAS